MHQVKLIPLIFIALANLAQAASATATLQMIWPDHMLNLDRTEAVQKAVTYLQSDDFAQEVVKMPKDKREKYAQLAGINSYRNTNALAAYMSQNLSIQSEPEYGDITVTFNCSDPEMAIFIAQHAARKAVNAAHYRIAEKSDPHVDSICQQMEGIQDQMQAIQSQIHIINQQRRTPANQHGANIGAPINMGRVVNPQGTQDRLQIESYQTQIKQLRQQYNALNKELSHAVNTAWKGKPKAGLVIIDHADLDA